MRTRRAIQLSDLPTAAAAYDGKTWYRATSCYAAVKPVQAERQPRDEAGGRVRFFADSDSAHQWVYETICAEINRLTEMLDAVMESRTRHAQTNQPKSRGVAPVYCRVRRER